MLADASPSTPPAGKPSLSPPPPDTPCESSTAGSVSSDKADHNDCSFAGPDTTFHSSAKPSTTSSSSLHAATRAFVPNVNAPAFVPDAAVKVSAINAHTANGTNGHPNGYGVSGNHTPSAHSGSSPHAAWDEAAYSEAAGYQNGWSGAYDVYAGYSNGYVGYGYGGMTPDGLFIPQQVLPSCLAAVQLSCLLLHGHADAEHTHPQVHFRVTVCRATAPLNKIRVTQEKGRPYQAYQPSLLYATSACSRPLAV